MQSWLLALQPLLSLPCEYFPLEYHSDLALMKHFISKKTVQLLDIFVEILSFLGMMNRKNRF